MLYLIGGFLPTETGRILLDGAPVAGPGPDRGIVFQHFALFPWKTVRANVLYGLEKMGLPREEREKRAQSFIDLVGLTGFEDSYPSQLSGGMKQRTAIARTLAIDPKILLMDEPFGALDAQTRHLMQAELLGIWRRSPKTVIFVTHDVQEAVYLADRVAVMTARPGRIKTVVDIALDKSDPGIAKSKAFIDAVDDDLGPRPRRGHQGARGARLAVSTLFRYLPLVLLAAGWELAARLGLVSQLALPPLSDVVLAWVEMIRSGELAHQRRFLALAGGRGPRSRHRRRSGARHRHGLVAAGQYALGPLVEMFYPMPKSALIPVTVLWLGFGDGSKILLIFLGCMLPVTIGAFNGARGSDQALVWSARSMGASRMRMLWDVVVPSALPEMLNGIRTALALAFILLVSSELIVAREGLGYLIGFPRRQRHL